MVARTVVRRAQGKDTVPGEEAPEHQAQPSTFTDLGWGRTSIELEGSAEGRARGVLQLPAHALSSATGFLQPVPGVKQPCPEEKMADRGKTCSLEALAEVGPGEAHLCGQILRREPPVNGIHGQVSCPQLPPGEKPPQGAADDGGGAPFGSLGQGPEEYLGEVLSRQENQVLDSGLPQAKQTDRVSAPLDEKHQAHVGKVAMEPGQYTFRGRICGKCPIENEGIRDGPFPYDPVEPGPGVAENKGVSGLQNVREPLLQAVISSQNCQ
jgi:hypothetical protein